MQKQGHWYRHDGTPAHTTLGKNGKERPTTLRDAREMKLYPSVTSILGILDKPQLSDWKQEQVALAAMRHPYTPGEDVDAWVERVKESAFEQVEQAADLGTSIHAALEMAMVGEPFDPALAVYVDPVVKWKADGCITIVEREKNIVNPDYGFAGTSDAFFRYGSNGIGVLDYKTRKTKPGRPAGAYSDQAMQLAAYAATYWGEESIGRVRAVNIFISTTEPGRMDVVEHVALPGEWAAVKLLAALWRHVKEYDPR